MLTAIYFDDQTIFMADEVDNVFSYWRLTAELKAPKLAIFKRRPQLDFCICGVISKFSCGRFGRDFYYPSPNLSHKGRGINDDTPFAILLSPSCTWQMVES